MIDDKLMGLPTQPKHVPWPTEDWPIAPLSDTTDATAFHDLVELAFSNPDTLGETHAFVAVQSGQLVFERYGDGYGPDQTYPSWSMAKSMAW